MWTIKYKRMKWAENIARMKWEMLTVFFITSDGKRLLEKPIVIHGWIILKWILNMECKDVNWMRLKMTAFWDTALFSLVKVDRRFRGAYCVYHQGETTKRCIPEGCHLRTCRRTPELKSHLYSSCSEYGPVAGSCEYGLEWSLKSGWLAKQLLGSRKRLCSKDLIIRLFSNAVSATRSFHMEWNAVW
jgi:hypothetical protein